MHIFLIFKTFPELVTPRGLSTYVPRIYGFRIYKKKGSRFAEDKENDNEKQIEITHYSEDLLKKIRGKVEKKGMNQWDTLAKNTN